MKIKFFHKKKEKKDNNNRDDYYFNNFLYNIYTSKLLFDDNNIDNTREIINEFVENENKYIQKAQVNDNNTKVKTLNSEEVLKLLKEDIESYANFNTLNYTGNWMSNLNSYGDNIKYKLLFRLGRKKGFFSCLTYQQTFLKNLYDSNNTMKEVLQTPIFIAFNTINVVKKNNYEQEEIEFKKKVEYFKQQIIKAIESCELTGGAIVSIKDNQILIQEKDKQNVKEDDFLYKNNKNIFPISSINKPQGYTCAGIKPFGLSWFEDKIEALERDNEAMRGLHETMIRQALLLLKIPTDDFWKAGTQEQRDKLFKIAQEIGNRDANSTITVPAGVDADFKVANINLMEHINIHNQAKQELSCGIPVSIWEGKNDGIINIGGNDDGSCILLNKLKNSLRNNYLFFIKSLADKFFKEEVIIDFKDLKDIESRKEVEALEKIVNIINSATSNNIDLQSEANDILTNLLNRLKTSF